MSSRTPVIVLVATAASVAAFAAYQSWSGGGLRAPRPVDAAPRDAFLVGEADVAALRSSPLGELLELAAGPGGLALGLGTAREACGFDVLERLDRLVLAVPEAEGQDEIGIAGKVRVTSDEARRCAEHLVEARGGAATTRSVGSFQVLEDASKGLAGSPRPRLAFHPSGLVLVSRGPWLDAMIDAAEGRGPRVDAHATHGALRKSLAAAPGFGAPAALVTVVLPKSLRERVRRETLAEEDRGRERATAAADAGLPPAPPEPDGSLATLRAVLGVSGAGAALALAPSSSAEAPLRLRAELLCESEGDCARVAKVVEEKRAAWSKNLGLRLAGLGPLVESLEVHAHGTTIEATASTSGESLARAARFLRNAVAR